MFTPSCFLLPFPAAHFFASIREMPSQCLHISYKFGVLCSLGRWFATVFLSSYSRYPIECFLLPGRIKKLRVYLETRGMQLKTGLLHSGVSEVMAVLRPLTCLPTQCLRSKDWLLGGLCLMLLMLGLFLARSWLRAHDPPLR